MAALAPPKLQNSRTKVVACPINCGDILFDTLLKTLVTTMLYQNPESIAPISINQRLCATPSINNPRANGIKETIISCFLNRANKPSKQIPERIPINIMPLKIKLAWRGLPRCSWSTITGILRLLALLILITKPANKDNPTIYTISFFVNLADVFWLATSATTARFGANSK